MLTKDEARRIAANIAELPALLSTYQGPGKVVRFATIRRDLKVSAKRWLWGAPGTRPTVGPRRPERFQSSQPHRSCGLTSFNDTVPRKVSAPSLIAPTTAWSPDLRSTAASRPHRAIRLTKPSSISTVHQSQIQHLVPNGAHQTADRFADKVFTGRPPNCKPIIVKRCPAGSVGVYPDCRCPDGTTGARPTASRSSSDARGARSAPRPTASRSSSAARRARSASIPTVVARTARAGTPPNCMPIVR